MRASLLLLLADAAGGFKSVHFGHLNVHQHQVHLFPVEHLDRFEPV